MKQPLVLQLGTAGPLYGAERWILALCRSLDPARTRSRIAVIDDSPGEDAPPLLTAAATLGIATDRIVAPGRFNPAAVRELRALIERDRVDIVHSHGYKADAVALLAVRGTNARVVATPHGWSHDAGWKLRLYEWLDRRMFRFADAVAPLSEDLAAELGGSVSAKVRLIPNGVDLAEIDAASAIAPEVAAWKAHGPVIGYVGQLIARKDIATLIDAFAQWGQADARLVLVGEGDGRAALEAQAARLGIADRTHFAGFRADRLAWMRGFDLFVLPSLVEGMPRCLMEAMAAGVPVAVSDIPGSRDLVRHGETGQVFAPGDRAALAELLASVDDVAALGDMALRARELVQREYSAHAMARRYEDLFDELAG